MTVRLDPEGESQQDPNWEIANQGKLFKTSVWEIFKGAKLLLRILERRKKENVYIYPFIPSNTTTYLQTKGAVMIRVRFITPLESCLYE